MEESLSATDPAFFEERLHAPDSHPPGDIRTAYERDRGRVIHSSGFRRLQGKTQVMGVGEGDFHRTRLTHSIECAQVGAGLIDQLERTKSIPSAFEKWTPSRPLIEAACFAHDLGHPPFGHGGEKALHKAMAATGGFEGNGHTLRLLTRLEKYKQQGWGINPTRRLLLAILKYPIPYSVFDRATYASKPPKCYFNEEDDVVAWAVGGFSAQDQSALRERDEKGKARYRTFDSSVMELADDIAYGVHDIEDIVARKLADQAKVRSALAAAFASVEGHLETNTGRVDAATIADGLFGGSFERKQAISRLVSAFITSVRASQRGHFEHPLLEHVVVLPKKHRVLLDSLRDMSFDLVIKKAPVQQLERRGMRLVFDIFQALRENPEQLVPASSWEDGDLRATTERRVCDYVAGMTDNCAERVYRRLFVPGFGSSSDEL
jgi:dGTPase